MGSRQNLDRWPGRPDHPTVGQRAQEPHRRWATVGLLRGAALTMLLAMGLAPHFLLFPLVRLAPGWDPTLPPVILWVSVAVGVGTLNALAGPHLRRGLYRATGLILIASLLSCVMMPSIFPNMPPMPDWLRIVLGLDGEDLMDADLYEAFLAIWLACLAATLLVRVGIVRMTGRHESRSGA